MNNAFDILKSILTAVSGEVNLLALAEAVGEAESQSPSVSFQVAIDAIRDNAVTVFPDSQTRPLLLFVLEHVERVLNMPAPAAE